MVYCRKAGSKLVACYPSQCTRKKCGYRVAALATYDSDRAIVSASGIDYCTTRCMNRCAFSTGILCNTEIERLLHRGLTVEDALDVDLSAIQVP
jgi:hypothetical protein